MKMICRECHSPLHSKLNHENVYLVEPCEMCLEKLNAEIRYKDDLLQEKMISLMMRDIRKVMMQDTKKGIKKGIMTVMIRHL